MLNLFIQSCIITMSYQSGTTVATCPWGRLYFNGRENPKEMNVECKYVYIRNKFSVWKILGYMKCSASYWHMFHEVLMCEASHFIPSCILIYVTNILLKSSSQRQGSSVDVMKMFLNVLCFLSWILLLYYS